jgi:hypothetical protein
MMAASWLCACANAERGRWCVSRLRRPLRNGSECNGKVTLIAEICIVSHPRITNPCHEPITSLECSPKSSLHILSVMEKDVRFGRER